MHALETLIWGNVIGCTLFLAIATFVLFLRVNRKIKRETSINSNKLLAHLHRLVTGFDRCNKVRLSDETVILIGVIDRGDLNQGATPCQLSREKLLAHLHKLATDFYNRGEALLCNEMQARIDEIEHGEFNQGTKGN